MGVVRKIFDWAARPSRGDRKPETAPARGRDLELWRWERERGKAEYLATRAGIRKKAATDLLANRERRTAIELDQVKPQAEAELQRRQEIARQARDELSRSETVVLREERTHTRGRAL